MSALIHNSAQPYRENVVKSFVKILALIFLCEAMVMVILHLLSLRSKWDILLDPILLTGMVTVFLYGMILRPMRNALEELKKAETSLRRRNREILAMSETLRKNQREMAQREKMVAIGTMAAGIAHEIGNPLACLSAVVQLLNRRQRCAEDHRHLHTLHEQIDRIAKIVKQLVDFAKPAPSEWVIADLDDLIEQTLKMLRYSLRVRQARIESIRNKNLPKVRIIPQQFQQILVNLLLNALDAVEDLEGEQVIRVERLAEDSWVKVMVKDGGCGMTKEQIRQALEPFYTTKSPGKGTGLGLAVCYRFIEYHQGRIHIDSAPGRGTVVTVSFPAPGRNADKPGSANAPSQDASA